MVKRVNKRGNIMDESTKRQIEYINDNMQMLLLLLIQNTRAILWTDKAELNKRKEEFNIIYEKVQNMIDAKNVRGWK